MSEAKADHAFMSFCTSLRRRESCEKLLPVLTSPSGHSLREKALTTHDVEISRSNRKQDATRTSRFLIFTASNLTCANTDRSMTRLRQFVSLTGGCYSAVIFLLYSNYLSHSDGVVTIRHVHQQRDIGGLEGFSHLQTLLLTSNISIPILPVPSPISFPPIIDRFIDGVQHIAHKPSIPRTVTELLPYCTSTPPMSEDATATTTDLFPGLREFAMFHNKQEVSWRLVHSGVSAEEARAVVEFWDEEFVAE